MEGLEHVDLDTNGLNLIDFSSENDDLFFTASPVSHQYKITECREHSTGFETVGDKDSGNVSQGNDQLVPVPELAKSEEPERVRSGKCNLRKSLAWDNEFFTSAGVLDPEELTSMMDRREIQKQFLPGIQEDMQRSTDSISTLESDHFTLESLEDELFEDIRASIQKSSTTAKGTFGKKAIQKDGDQVISVPNGDSVAQNQPKSEPVSKKVTGVHKIGVPKCQPKVNTATQGSMKAVKPESSRSVVPKNADRIGESTSTLFKPPMRTIKSSSTTPSGTKVTSLGPSHPKTENTKLKTVAIRGAHAPNMSSPDGPCRISRKSGSTSKSSPREPSMPKTQFTRFSSKGASCDPKLSEDEVKPSLATVRRKAPSKAVNSSSNLQSSSKNASLKNKVISENSAVAAYLMSSKVISSKSPASSVSEWSSTSLSSSSVFNQKSDNSRSCFGSSSCRSVDGDPLLLNIESHSNNQIRRCQETKRSTESFKKTASQAGVVSGSVSVKPTGLRMPSPKIGFFDGVKSVRASCGGRQSHGGLPVALSKVGGISPRGIANNKHKVGKIPHGRVSTVRKHETEHPNASLSPQGNPHVTPHVNGNQEKKMVESLVVVKENGTGEHDELSLKENLVGAKNEMMLGVNQDFCLKDDKSVDPEPKSKTDSCQPTSNASERLDDFKIDEQHDLGSSLNSCCKIDQKESLPWEDGMDQSRKHEGGVMYDTVDLQNIEPLLVLSSEVN